MSSLGRRVLADRVDETMETFGAIETRAIMEEVMYRLSDGGTAQTWLDMIDTVVIERHPYLRFAEMRLD